VSLVPFRAAVLSARSSRRVPAPSPDSCRRPADGVSGTTAQCRPVTPRQRSMCHKRALPNTGFARRGTVDRPHRSHRSQRAGLPVRPDAVLLQINLIRREGAFAEPSETPDTAFGRDIRNRNGSLSAIGTPRTSSAAPSQLLGVSARRSAYPCLRGYRVPDGDRPTRPT
jgi:hypothetical protein